MSQPPRIYVAGHTGMVGSAIVRGLIRNGHPEGSIIVRSHSSLDLTDQRAVRSFFESEKPEQVYLAAAKVGGIHANHAYPAEFIYQNLMIGLNVIHSAFLSGTQKLLNFGSSCIYPKFASQPIQEDSLLSGSLEPTNEPYSIAKISAVKLCEMYSHQHGETNGVDFRSVMPTNLYGPGDNYDPENSHVIPGLFRRFHRAALDGAGEVVVWGSGSPRREFLYVDDLASAAITVMDLPRAVYDSLAGPSGRHLNVGSGQEVSIAELAMEVARAVGFQGQITFDASRPDGPPRKLLQSEKIRSVGWRPTVDLRSGLREAYRSFVKQVDLVSGSPQECRPRIC